MFEIFFDTFDFSSNSGASLNRGGDTLIGSNAADPLFGGSGNDNIQSGDGNDEAVGGLGKDTLFGHAGDDVIYGGRAIISTDDSADIIDGGDGNDQLYGNGGDDSIAGGNGNDTAFGGLDNDRIISGNGDDVVTAGIGRDSIISGAGNDVVFGGDDFVSINDQEDVIDGGAGDDSLYGNGGHDSILGGDGHDLIFSGIGNDTILAGAGNDTISFDVGRNIVEGGTGMDAINLGKPIDQYDFSQDGDFITITDKQNPDMQIIVKGVENYNFNGDERTPTDLPNIDQDNSNITDGSAVVSSFVLPDSITLSTGADVVNNTVINTTAINTVITEAAHLNAADNIDTGGGDILSIVNGGTFNLNSPALLSGLSTVQQADNSALTLTLDNDQALDIATGTADDVFHFELNNKVWALGDAIDAGAGVHTLNITGGGTVNFNVPERLENIEIITIDGNSTNVILDDDGYRVNLGAGNHNVTGGAGADAFTSTINALDSNDTLNGAAGDNVLNISDNGSVNITAGNDLANSSHITHLALAVGGTIISDDAALATSGVHTYISGGALALNTGVNAARYTVMSTGTITLDNGSNNALTLADTSDATIAAFADVAAIEAAYNGGTIISGAGSDTVLGGNGNDDITIGTGDDSILGGNGNDTISLTDNVISAGDTLNGGSGDNVISITGGGVNFNLASPTTAISNIANVTIDNNASTVMLFDGAATVVGEDGGNIITLGSGGQTLTSGSGADNITSGSDADTITLGGGADTINLGMGDGAADQIRFSAVTDGATAGAGTGQDSILQFEMANDMFFFGGDFNTGGTRDLDDITNNDSLAFVTDLVPNFTTTHEMLVLTGLEDADLTQTGLGNLTSALDNIGLGAGIISVAGNDGLIIGQGSTQSALYTYVESELVNTGITANELTLLATVDAQLTGAEIGFF